VPVAINGRTRCFSLKAALPRPSTADPRLLAAKAALGVDLGRARDRRGRRAVSVGKLLGAKRVQIAEGALKQGLATLDRLRVRETLASSLATASAKGCAGKAGKPQQSTEFKGNGYDATVDVGKGEARIGVDLGEGGVRAEIELGICEEGEEKFKAPDCPSADGTLEASDENNFFVGVRITRNGELLLSQKLDFSGETAIRPIQVDDDAKLEYFEIDHSYRTSIELGGSTQEFGAVSLKVSYHGSTRVNFPGATYDPTHTDVEVKFKMEGADPHDLHEIEFDQSLRAKAEADRNFAAEVDKAIRKLAEKEKIWNTPNRCVDLKFDPPSGTLTLQRDETGAFKAHVESRQGGAPPSGKWTRLSEENATIGPASALANPATFNYTVTNAGTDVEVSGQFTVTSRAGVAVGTWTQATKPPPPPPPKVMAGLISGSADYDGNELGAGNELHANWGGKVKLLQEPPFQNPTTTYNYKLTSGSITYTFDGTVSNCHVHGEEPIDLGAQFDLTTSNSLTLFEESQRTYQLLIPAPMFAQVHGIKSSCTNAEDNGDPFDWFTGAGIPALVNSPKGKPVAADWSFIGLGSGDTGPGSPDQTWNWSFAPAP
jgi:hypothetical protein